MLGLGLVSELSLPWGRVDCKPEVAKLIEKCPFCNAGCDVLQTVHAVAML